MKKQSLRLQADFAFSQIMFLGNESPFAMKHQRPVMSSCRSAEKGTVDARLSCGGRV
ncbi:hypothetical protein [uncultured Oscillibacter sp.]|uniref:hypothetical protein n=1 Tax=uncultured Oscillibacter sp. TaxID=876091 RepID=UPI0025FB123E|nr:hypothetical protein [uncultured Oscillibacter sp.]